MTGFNHITLAGNLTRDPELRYTKSGTGACSFGLAVNRKYKTGDELKEEVLFMDCIAFGKLGETAAGALKKGGKALVAGRLQCRDWEDREGSTRKAYEVVAESIVFL